MKTEEETYTIRVKCSNCSWGSDFEQFMKIPKGTKVRSYLEFEECPNCNCMELIND